MIFLDEKKIEKALFKVIEDNYVQPDLYLVLESLEEDFDWEDDGRYLLIIKGRFGWEGGKTQTNFEITVDPVWPMEYVQGYFQHYIESLEQ